MRDVELTDLRKTTESVMRFPFFYLRLSKAF